jgi:hypothetical protein
MFFSGFVGGESFRSIPQQRERNAPFIVKHAVEGLLPKNRIAAKMLAKLRVLCRPRAHARGPEPDQDFRLIPTMSATATNVFTARPTTAELRRRACVSSRVPASSSPMGATSRTTFPRELRQAGVCPPPDG